MLVFRKFVLILVLVSFGLVLSFQIGWAGGKKRPEYKGATLELQGQVSSYSPVSFQDLTAEIVFDQVGNVSSCFESSGFKKWGRSPRFAWIPDLHLKSGQGNYHFKLPVEFLDVPECEYAFRSLSLDAKVLNGPMGEKGSELVDVNLLSILFSNATFPSVSEIVASNCGLIPSATGGKFAECRVLTREGRLEPPYFAIDHYTFRAQKNILIPSFDIKLEERVVWGESIESETLDTSFRAGFFFRSGTGDQCSVSKNSSGTFGTGSEIYFSSMNMLPSSLRAGNYVVHRVDVTGDAVQLYSRLKEIDAVTSQWLKLTLPGAESIKFRKGALIQGCENQSAIRKARGSLEGLVKVQIIRTKNGIETGVEDSICYSLSKVGT